ncbi:hypothetical protein COV53_03060 [Candidatus Gottesmanbacteria bacterium CG11_big_fil_rev_8_21_14_0_20_37_11]|uniref:Antitoxin n=3 Tax=Candidatus Gottesmaniibacteriota TaxID=1752720 RepID=A0A2M7RR09_9BACT|nr:MAG: hypothetical protein AUJ73_00730 [Candidatus Gottesmanbacteria bacterium CG1_02_37_22]PIP33235.1 MAG: hypothetical protein COX23_00455 [Candidatus Gottesmanbacteria bacterium CG23_combo_of_CG06-09_8_20_14_all_37_19]PIR08430.1 MAG: hypothetical protein COV53_03060 [Candidatus Gottesmanbacteria bacterium CG11_big_fil_rev_8_21_14_0_20_37_11]PIZ02404.1 MAG: hypothetical protein COY59_04975 [Candidatus Gottesmanbacteria bacterium CG_4_10_14_0_8_um_filter_37_24]
MDTNLNNIIPITDLRRRFGEITENLAEIEGIILTKGGQPFAILKAVPSAKKKILVKAKGAWKGTRLDKDDLWKEVFKRKSRTNLTI